MRCVGIVYTQPIVSKYYIIYYNRVKAVSLDDCYIMIPIRTLTIIHLPCSWSLALEYVHIAVPTLRNGYNSPFVLQQSGSALQ